jgi:peptide/nickel transport system substrate-binding protein
MKRLTNLGFILVLAALFGALAVMPVFAQGGEGGIIIEPNSNSGSDVATMNPLLVNDIYSSRIASLLFPTIVNVDPEAGVFAPGARGGLATAWEYSNDGKTITYTLRDDWKWSDGTPITSADFLYAYEAVADDATGSPRNYVTAVIESVEAPDPQTLIINYTSNACNNLDYTAAIFPVPSHILQEQTGGDFATMAEIDFNKNPTVSAGPFTFAGLRPGEQVSLAASTDYPDALNGVVNPTGFIYKNVPDANVALEQFLANEINMMAESIPPQQYADLRERAAAGDIQVFEQLDNGYQFIAFNLADPTNPQNAFDDAGEPIDQGHHPIFGDVRVRRALAMGLNMDDVIKGALFGEGVPISNPGIPASWAHNPELLPPAYDPEAAMALLAEAGWTDEDGDGVLEAHGAMYAEDGTPLQFDFLASAGDVAVESTGQLVQDQWKQIGVNANLQILDFNVVVENLLGQTYDTVLIGWNLAYPDDPDFGTLFNAANDVVGSGFNTESYNNPEVEELLQKGNTVPGCDPAERAKFYHEAQALLAADQPFIFLYSKKLMWVAAGNLEGFAPFPNQLLWNVDTWGFQ